jgi:methionyl-tRNA formyltransferase
LQPWPGAQTTFRRQPLQIWRAHVGDSASSAAPGSVLGARPLVIACGEGTLELQEVQMEGRKRIPAGDFANGQRLTENEKLGEGSL